MVGVKKSNSPMCRTVLAMIGKFFASSSFALVYIFTAEIFPTPIRSSGVGLCSTMARIGGISAPQIALALPKVGIDKKKIIGPPD